MNVPPIPLTMRMWHGGCCFSRETYLFTLILGLSLLWKCGQGQNREGFSINVEREVTVQRGLCVNIPCTFTVPDNIRLSESAEGIWFKRTADVPSYLVSSKASSGSQPGAKFKITGDVRQGDCSLSIRDVEWSDQAMYFFRIEDGNTKFSYMSTMLIVNVKELTAKPEISRVGSLMADSEVTLTCTSPGRCAGSPPIITWERGGLNSVVIKDGSVNYQDGGMTYYSNITFTPTRKSDKSLLTCRVSFPKSGPTTDASITINVHYNQATPGYNILVQKEVTAQTGLCVHIPCSFTTPKGKILSENTQGFWYKGSGLPPRDLVSSNYGPEAKTRGRFVLTGDVSKGDCSLTIDNVQWSDQSVYLFRVEDGEFKFNYLSTLPKVTVKELTDKPEISSVRCLMADREATLTCTSPMTCVGSLPVFAWEGAELLTNVAIQRGSVDYQNGSKTFYSNITFTPTMKSDQSLLTCRVSFPKNGSTINASITLTVHYDPKNQQISNSSPTDCGVDTKLIVGIVVGNIFILILMGLGLLYHIKKSKEQDKPKENKHNDLEQNNDKTESTYENLKHQNQDIYHTMKSGN